MSGAPTSQGAAWGSNRPDRRVFKNRVSSARHREAAGEDDPAVAFRRCWPKRRDPLGLEPWGKLLKAERTESGLAMMGWGWT